MVDKSQWLGNSLAIRIPKAIADDLDIREVAVVDVNLENDRLVTSPAKPEHYALSDLLVKVTYDNVHGETDWGPEVGKED